MIGLSKVRQKVGRETCDFERAPILLQGKGRGIYHAPPRIPRLNSSKTPYGLTSIDPRTHEKCEMGTLLASRHSVAVDSLESTKTGRQIGSRLVVSRFNDPSAGSPTETLLRLLLPLGGRV